MSSWTKYFPVWSSHSVRKHIVFSALVCLKKCYLIQGRFSVNHKIILRLVMWTLYTLTSVCIFSTQFFIHLLRCLQGEFVSQSNGFFPADHFLNSHDLNVWLRSDIVGEIRYLALLGFKGLRLYALTVYWKLSLDFLLMLPCNLSLAIFLSFRVCFMLLLLLLLGVSYTSECTPCEAGYYNSEEAQGR